VLAVIAIPLDLVGAPASGDLDTAGWEWDGATLTIQNLTMNIPSGSPAILLPGGATLEVKGVNNITVEGDGIEFFDGVDDGDSTINAAGAVLNINSRGTAICTDLTSDMHLIINGGTFGLTIAGEGTGISSFDTLKINNADVTITNSMEGIKANGDISISGGKITINDSSEEGILAQGSVNITNGNVTIEAGYEGIEAGRYGEGDINITDSIVNLECSMGMKTDYNVTMIGGKIDIIAYSGIEAHGNITITGTELTIATEDENNESIIANSGIVTINSGKIDITAKAIAGISAYSINIKGGSGTISGDKYAVIAAPDETLSVAPSVTVWDPVTKILAIIDEGLVDFGAEGSFPQQYFINPNGAILPTVQFDVFTVKVTKGTGGGDKIATTQVILEANADTAAERFVNWTFDPAVTLAAGSTSTSRNITFTMPFEDVTATANFVNRYTVTVTGGSIIGPDGSTPIGTTASFWEGDEVHISAGPRPAGQRFKEWIITPAVSFVPDHGSLTMPDSEFIMPASDVTVVAVFEDIPTGEFLITVSHVGRGVANADAQSAAPGATVTIRAVPDSGNRFVRWEVVSGGVTLSSTITPTATFTMPNTPVEVRAVFEGTTATSPQTGDYSNTLFPMIVLALCIAGVFGTAFLRRRHIKQNGK